MMDEELKLFFAQATLDSTVREEVLHGDNHIVRAVQIIKPMVLFGVNSGGVGQLLPSDELRKCRPMAWNTKPLTLGHPYVEESGARRFVSIGEPGMLQRFGIGMIFNAAFDDKVRLGGEAWLNERRCKAIGGSATSALTAFRDPEKKGEISSAYGFTLDPTSGTHEGTAYNGVQRALAPDHVSLIMDGVGACSNEDTCGWGINCADGSCSVHANQAGEDERLIAKLRRLFTGATFNDIERSVRNAVNMRFINAFVDEVEDRPRRVIFDNGSGLMALPFSVDRNGVVTLGEGEPTPVQRSTRFIAANQEKPVDKIETWEQFLASNEVDQSVKNKATQAVAFMDAEQLKQAAAREKRVVELAANERVKFSLDDLKGMTESQLDAVAEMVKEPEQQQQMATNFQGRGVPGSQLGQKTENTFVSRAETERAGSASRKGAA